MVEKVKLLPMEYEIMTYAMKIHAEKHDIIEHLIGLIARHMDLDKNKVGISYVYDVVVDIFVKFLAVRPLPNFLKELRQLFTAGKPPYCYKLDIEDFIIDMLNTLSPIEKEYYYIGMDSRESQ